jgi:two-component system sensor histidine kinase VicK
MAILFQRFVQLGSADSRKPGGTGLGLAISKEIIQAHQGKIWIESEPAKGATFYFTLPLAPL